MKEEKFGVRVHLRSMVLSNNFKDFLQTPSWFFYSFGSLFYSKVTKDLEILDQEDDVTEELIIDEEENETDEDEPNQTPEKRIRQRQPRTQISSV